jgi:hypothetical protein
MDWVRTELGSLNSRAVLRSLGWRFHQGFLKLDFVSKAPDDLMKLSLLASPPGFQILQSEVGC